MWGAAWPSSRRGSREEGSVRCGQRPWEASAQSPRACGSAPSRTQLTLSLRPFAKPPDKADAGRSVTLCEKWVWFSFAEKPRCDSPFSRPRCHGCRGRRLRGSGLLAHLVPATPSVPGPACFRLVGGIFWSAAACPLRKEETCRDTCLSVAFENGCLMPHGCWNL